MKGKVVAGRDCGTCDTYRPPTFALMRKEPCKSCCEARGNGYPNWTPRKKRENVPSPGDRIREDPV